jgi:isopentenyl-diphosphate delta-isomerase
MEHVVLVDGEDKECGLAEKFAAHRHPAKLHRAFSVYVFDDKGQLLIQKRNRDKKTWPAFWSNSCCSHPRPNEAVIAAAQRRLQEELGFTCEVRFLFGLEYKAQFDADWGEHEYLHVLLGSHNGSVKPDPSEVEEFAFADLDWLLGDMEAAPEKYTPWFKICFPRVLYHIRKMEARTREQDSSLFQQP